MKYLTAQLDSNFSVSLLVKKETQLINAVLLNDIGAGQSAWPEGGVHFLEHLLAHETTNFGGGDAFTNRQNMWLQNVVLQEDLRVIQTWLKALFGGKFLTARRVEHEKKVIRAENRHHSRRFDREFLYKWNQAIWSDPAMARSGVGRDQAVAQLNLKTLKAVYAGFCGSSHHLYLSGNIEEQWPQLLEQMRKVLTPLKNAQPAVTFPDLTPESDQVLPRQELRVGIGFAIDANLLHTFQDHLLLELVNKLYVSGSNAVLRKVLKQKVGEMYAPIDLRAESGQRSVIGLKVNVLPEIWQEARPDVESALLADIDINEEDFQKLKKRWLLRTIYALEDRSLFSHWIAQHHWVLPAEAQPDLVDFWRHELSQVTREDLQEKIHTVIQPKYLRIVEV